MTPRRSKARVTHTAPAGDGHAVLTLVGGGRIYRKEPCAECPWRKDRPIGVFPAEAYRHSARTAYDMAPSTFACHMSGKENPSTCAGFLISNGAHNLAVRLADAVGRIDWNAVRSPVALYESYRAMAVANGVSPGDPCLQHCRDDGQTRSPEGES